MILRKYLATTENKMEIATIIIEHAWKFGEVIILKKLKKN